MEEKHTFDAPMKKEDYAKAVSRFQNGSIGSYRKAGKPILLPSGAGGGRGGAARYDIDVIKRWLENPSGSSKSLVEFSNHMYQANDIYKWFVTILANMPTWDWVLSMDTYQNKKKPDLVEKLYRQGAQYGNLKYSKYDLNIAWKTAIKEDWFFGYEVESDDSYHILKLDAEFCRVSTIYDDGIKGFQFNFAYFDGKNDKNDKKPRPIIASYPDEFRKGYAQYQRTGESWIPLNPLNTVCWKMNDEIPYAVPYFATLFPSLNDIGFYKELGKDRAEMDNLLLLHQKIPVDTTKIDKFAVNLDLAADFDMIAQGEIPEWASMFTSPMDVTAIKTDRGNTEKDRVKDATDQAYTGAGLPLQLANPTTAAGLASAIMANENIVYRFYRQVEATINFKMKYKFSNAKFKTRILDITNFSKDTKTKELLTGAQSGLVPAMHVASAFGSNPYETLNDIDLENNILNLTLKLRPLQTSYTLGSDGAGAPVKDDKDTADSTQATRDTGANDNR